MVTKAASVASDQDGIEAWLIGEATVENARLLLHLHSPYGWKCACACRSALSQVTYTTTI